MSSVIGIVLHAFAFWNWTPQSLLVAIFAWLLVDGVTS